MSKLLKVCISKSVTIPSSVYQSIREAGVLELGSFIDKKTQFYVSTPEEVGKQGTQIRKCIQNKILVVNEQFLHDSLSYPSIVHNTPSQYILLQPMEEEEYSLHISQDSRPPVNLQARSSLKPNRKREVKVFVSSTFRDMKRERQELTKMIFPQLKYFCQQRNVEFSYIDLRWGITEADAKNAQVLHSCLHEVDNSRPYFISMLGEYYGWAQNAGHPVDPLLEDTFKKASESFPWVMQYKDRSITELEIIYGALQPELSPYVSDHAKYPRSFFYFRDPLLITRTVNEDIDLYEEGSMDGSRKLSELKERIRHSSHPFYDGYSSFEKFGQIVLEDLKNAIDIDFPETEDAAKSVQRSIAGEISSHSSTCHFSRPKIEKEICNYIENGVIGKTKLRKNAPISPLILQGGIGTGKSFILSKISQKYADKMLVVPFFLNNKSTFQKMITSMMKIFSCNFSVGELTSLSQSNSNLAYILPQFVEAIAHQIKTGTSKFSNVLIIIDDIDFVKSDLIWLPNTLPSSFRIIVSTFEASLASSCTTGTPLVYTMDELAVDEIESYSKSFLLQYGKKFDDKQMGFVRQSPSSRNFLFLKTLLEEVILEDFESITNQLQKYLSMQSVPDLFSSIMKQWIHQYFPEDLHKKYVRDILGVLLISRNGLDENEIREILNIPYSSSWLAFISMLKDFLGTNQGVITFPHQKYRYALEKIISKDSKQRYRDLVINYFHSQSLNPRAFEEVPFQLSQKSPVDKHSLKLLLDFMTERSEVIDYLYQHDRENLFQYVRLLFDHQQQLEVHLYLSPVEYLFTRFKRNPNPDHSEAISTVRSMIALSKTCYKLGHLSTSESIIETCAEMLSSARNMDQDFDRLREKLSHLAIVYIDHCKYSNAQSLLTSLGSPSDIKRIALEALMLKKQSQYERAKELYLNALSSLQKSHPHGHPKLGVYLILLADVYRKLGEYGEAISRYVEAKAISEKSYGSTHPVLAEIYTNMGLVAKKQGSYKAAFEYYQRAASILQKSYGDRSIIYGTLLNYIADVHRKLGNYSQSTPMYYQSLSIFEDHYGHDHPEVADVLNNLGVSFKKQGKYAEARVLLDRALTIINASYGMYHYKYALILNNIADIERKTGNFNQAIEYYQRALQIDEQLLGSSHNEVAEVLNNIGIVYKKQGKYPQAKDAYQRAMQIIMTNFGALHFKMGLYLNNIADVYRKEKNYEKALEVYHRSLQIISNALGDQHSEVAEVYQNIALVCVAQKEFNNAKEYLDKSLVILKNDFGDVHPKIGLCIHKFGLLEEGKQQFQKAISLFLQSLKILQDTLSPSHPEIGDVLVDLGDTYARSRQNSLAIATYIQAIKIVYNSFGDTHYKFTELREKITSTGGTVPNLTTVVEKKVKNQPGGNQKSSGFAPVVFASAIGFI